MTVDLTPDQEHRIQALLERGVYGSVEEVVDACLRAVEQHVESNFKGNSEQLEKLLLEGLNSPELSEQEFWSSVDGATEALLAGNKAHQNQ
jgi:putative addiction module CopG family antidote